VLALFDQAIAARQTLKNYVIVDGILRRGPFKTKVAPGNLPIHTPAAVGIFWLVITAYLKNGGTLEKAAAIANHASTAQSVDRAGRDLVGELDDGLRDPPPSGRAVVVADDRELISSSDSFPRAPYRRSA
jgi:hypothetical protein